MVPGAGIHNLPGNACRTAVIEIGLLRQGMNYTASNRWTTAALLAICLCFPIGSLAKGTDQKPSSKQLLAQAEDIRSSNPQQFGKLLEELRQRQAQLSASQRWHLRFLEAAQLTFQNQYAKAEPILREVVAHAPDPGLVARARAALLQSRYLARDYQTAYTLAHKLMSSLPQLTDTHARRVALDRIVQMLSSAGQYDLALKYAREVKSSFHSEKGQCSGSLLVAKTLLHAHKLDLDAPEIENAVKTCLRIGELASANALRLDVAGMMLEQGHPQASIDLLKKIAPSVKKSGYKIHVGGLHMELAQAYAKLGKDRQARRHALLALSENAPDAVNYVVQGATQVMFEVEKRAGDSASALGWYEKYTAQKQNAADDAKARALAYQMVHQDVLDKQIKLDVLARQNSVLKLRKNLADKAAETGRLYIALLVLLLAFIGIWLYRTKHAQLRFQRMAQHDDLTGAFNRHHFLAEAQRVLDRMQHSDLDACLVLLDLDYFKQVNDLHGHAAGDEVLTQTVDVCRGDLRPQDLFGRLGGEEFGILLPTSSIETGIGISNRIRRKLAETNIVTVSGVEVKVTASFGLACTDQSGHALTDLLRVADAALYRAKRAGRNQLAVGGRATPL